jgi:hypothetical protein
MVEVHSLVLADPILYEIFVASLAQEAWAKVVHKPQIESRFHVIQNVALALGQVIKQLDRVSIGSDYN